MKAIIDFKTTTNNGEEYTKCFVKFSKVPRAYIVPCSLSSSFLRDLIEDFNWSTKDVDVTHVTKSFVNSTGRTVTYNRISITFSNNYVLLFKPLDSTSTDIIYESLDVQDNS